MQGFDIGAAQRVLALGAAPASQRDDPAELGIGRLRARQQDQFRSVIELHFGTDDQGDPGRLGGFQGTHDAGQRTLVGDRERAVSELCRTLEQFVRTRGATLEAEVAQRVQFGIPGRVQANHPCSIQWAVSSRAT